MYDKLNKHIIYIIILSFLLLNSCDTTKEIAVLNNDFQNFSLQTSEQEYEFFISAIGHLHTMYGGINHVLERTIISYHDGKKDYFLNFTNSSGDSIGIAFRIYDLIDDDIICKTSDPGYFICYKNEALHCMRCQLDKPTVDDPTYGCWCSHESFPGGGNGGCSLVLCPGPNPANDFITINYPIGLSIINLITICDLSFDNF